jgi:hypothetical protein
MSLASDLLDQASTLALAGSNEAQASFTQTCHSGGILFNL